MRAEISSKNYRLDDELKALIIKKLNRFDKYFNTEAAAKVKLSRIGNEKFVMEISIEAGKMGAVRSVHTSNDMNGNLDVVLPRLEKQIVKYRTKLDDKFKKSALETPPIYDENAEVPADNGKIVKVKSFDVSTITVTEAMENMDMLGHNFYLFINKEGGKPSVLYSRNDGDYGLIESDK